MTSNLGQQELRELRKNNQQEKDFDENSSVSSSSGSGSSSSSSSSSGDEMRIGEKEVRDALKERDDKYDFMEKENEKKEKEIDIDNNDQNKKDLIAKNEEKINDLTLELVNKFFSLEFVNRIDEVIMFNPLNLESVQSICKTQILKVKSLLNARGKYVRSLHSHMNEPQSCFVFFNFIICNYLLIHLFDYLFFYSFVYLFILFYEISV